MRTLSGIPFLFTCAIGLFGCGEQQKAPEHDPTRVRKEIERILADQERWYGSTDEQDLQALAATCLDSMLFVGGDDGGLATDAQHYVHDLADGYMVPPHDRTFRIFDNTVIVTSLHQAYKLFGSDTLKINARSTKVFVRGEEQWKMAYCTYAPLPVMYTPSSRVDPKLLAAYAGRYRADARHIDTVSALNGRLYFGTAEAPSAELVPLNDSTFRGVGYFGQVIFRRDTRGAITHYVFCWPDGQHIAFPRIP